MTLHEKNAYQSKHQTLCWTCNWAGGKGEKCPWACKSKPVPGWKAIPTIVHGNGKSYGSFDVYECPLYELMEEIKKGIIENTGKRRECPKQYKKATNETVELIKNLRFVKKKTIEEISNITGFDSKRIQRILKRIKENETL